MVKFTLALSSLFLMMTCFPSSVRAEINIEVTFISPDGIELISLLEGSQGDGWLLYTAMDEEGAKPKIVVHLSKKENSEVAQASIFQTSVGMSGIPISVSDNRVSFSPEIQPAIVINALNGWWRRGDRVNYNLDIQIFGPIHSMWGAENWIGEMGTDQLAVDVQVRDEDLDGIPDWEIRRLIPEFPGKGFIRFNYSERKCETPTEVEEGVFSAWPFVAASVGYELIPGLFRPPIVVDWEAGRITYYSEMVTARNQNCSYTIYSIDPLDSSKLNSPNFETPFAFYDLSGEGVGYPNLILRTERNTENYSRVKTNDLFEHIRYSWRLDIGDWLWDYKVEVLGFHPYTSDTEIAGGQFQIDAPAYEEFPEWVMQKSWPMVTFVDTEGVPYRTSEGIYPWTPRYLGEDYFAGASEEPEMSHFGNIQEGLRGEYRILKNGMVQLYFSPIDQRIHLLHAEAGLFNLGDGIILRLHNLDGGAYIDGWTKEKEIINAEEEILSTVLERLYLLDDLMVYSSSDSIELRLIEIPPAVFKISPPTDNESWQQFRALINQYQPDGAPPPDPLAGWLDKFEGSALRIKNGTIQEVRSITGGYWIGFELNSGFEVSADEQFPFSLDNLSPGSYVLEAVQGKLTVEKRTPADLNLELSARREDPEIVASGYQINLIAKNQGLEDSPVLEFLLYADCEGEIVEILREKGIVAGKDEITWQQLWMPRLDQECQLIALLKDPAGNVVAETQSDVLDQPSIGIISNHVLRNSTETYLTLPVIEILVIIAGTTGWLFYRMIGNPRQSNDEVEDE
jgi:hypothetical protein